MNFYNPFKPHIVRNHDDTYSVRKLIFPFFKYYLEEDKYTHSYEDVPNFYWWSTPKYVSSYCKYNSLEMASALLNNYKQACKPKKKPQYVPIKDIIK